MKLEDAIQKFYPVNAQRKEIAKEEESLKKVIKKFLPLGEKAEAGEYVAEMKKQDRSYLDDDRVIALLKEQGFEHAIKTVEKPDSDELEKLIAHGHIEPIQLQTCMVENFVGVLSVKKLGGKKSNEKSQTESNSKSTTKKPAGRKSAASKPTF